MKNFSVERYSRKEQFNSTNQSILSHPGLFPVIVARLHILLRLTGYETFEKRQCQNFIQIT
jgi:hypothetical protein